MLLYYKVGSEKMNCVLVRFILFVIFILFEVIFFVKIYKKYNMVSKIKLVILLIYCSAAFLLIINSFTYIIIKFFLKNLNLDKKKGCAATSFFRGVITKKIIKKIILSISYLNSNNFLEIN